MKPEQNEGHGGSEASSRKRTASDLREDEKHRKKVKDENSKTETGGKKREKKVEDENIKTDGKKKKTSSIPLQETQISSSGSVGADSGSCKPDGEHNREHTGEQQHKSKSSKEKRHRDVCEIAANSLDTKPMKKSKDEKREDEEVGSRGSENARREKEDKHQSGNKKSANEKKRKKENVEKEKSKKKVKKEGEREEKSQKSKKVTKVEEDNKWKWWEEGHTSDGRKWSFLEHFGPLFPPFYEPLPSNVSFYYNGQPMKLSLAAEEVATFYAKMLDHEYTTKTMFQENFFSDWKEEMTSDERALIRKLSKCDFTEIHKYFLEKSEEKKAMTKEQKQVLKEEANRLTEEYGFCTLDGHREKIGNFRVEPPGLFRGRGEHPKMGKLKKRIQPEDITINCSKDSKIPLAPEGHRWKKVQHDDGVTWLASWVENVQGNIKYVMLNPSSKLKGEKDWQKYEVARRLKEKVETIRRCYRNDWKNKEMKTRQRGVALYFIDKLALRAGNEKEESETADTVGCCSLRVEHIRLLPLLDGQENVVEFDFLGKDSIRYYNRVPVESRVFKNLKLFMENKDPEDDLFDRINTAYLNKFLNEAMPGLTAKVFRTFNASTTLQEQLGKLTSDEMSLQEKLLSYNRANRAVAILCNHQRAAPKTFEKSMQLLQDKISLKEQQLEAAKKELKAAKKEHKRDPTDKSRSLVERKEAAVMRLEEQLKKLYLQMTDKEENKVIALGTSKLNYLDPRISVAWCRKFNVPIEKIYNKTQRDKFAWAIDMTDDSFTF